MYHKITKDLKYKLKRLEWNSQTSFFALLHVFQGEKNVNCLAETRAGSLFSLSPIIRSSSGSKFTKT